MLITLPTKTWSENVQQIDEKNEKKSQGTNKFTVINLTIFVQCPAKIITKYIGTPPYGHLSVIRSTFVLNSSVSVEDVSRYFSLLISADVWYRTKHSLRLTSFSIVTPKDRGVFARLIHARFTSSCLNIKTI